MIYPSVETIRELVNTKQYGVIPICKEMYADVKTPMEVYEND